jgi:carbamoyltransferase
MGRVFVSLVAADRRDLFLSLKALSTLVGISGAKRNACAAVSVNGEVRAACEQERLTRVREIGVEAGGFPVQAIDAGLAIAGRHRADVSAYVVAEHRIEPGDGRRVIEVDHHRAHAATAFLTSPHDRAAILVCDGNPGRELSVWIGEGTGLVDRRWPWRGRAFTTLYSECAEMFGFARHGEEHRLETLAHRGTGRQAEELRAVIRYADGSVEVDPSWRAAIDQLIRNSPRCSEGQPVEAASAVQARIGELLLELVAEIRASVDTDTLCLGGGLFYNTYFNTLIQTAGIFARTFVPINPGNAGLAVGISRLEAPGLEGRRVPLSPFLGPEYDAEAIKTTLDGCKLSYQFLGDSEVVDAAVAALTRGQLVGWFQGRMEWGPRALGHRSILADPRSPYVLDNLNFFLRKRERSRPFGVSVCEDTVGDFFCGPPASACMEFQYRLRDDRLRHIIPPGATAIRVQTLNAGERLFWTLHKRMQQATGTGVLVNTSFNGFHEPIVCAPRDAVRVFYGTGLDMLVIGQFVLTK